ncbi:protein FRA10AC1-like [Chenopodium quinoa]|uniref:protein FRA10AC1-like n=1 Tax=Chenopodium quinoa TaxID=63459 RepID=UPI000B76F37E|nr:protein FRA10AC1-like [Chenopodium quinoa]
MLGPIDRHIYLSPFLFFGVQIQKPIFFSIVSPPLMASFSSLKSAIFDREERKQHYQAHIRGLNAYDKHKKFLNDYVKYYGKDRPAEQKIPIKTDKDALREGYRFIRAEEDDMDTAWEQRLVKRYYDKLFKEYCIADMSKYKSGKIGLRWRTEKEVISGKGQFICGNKHCDERNGLASFEVNFSYFEAGESKQALVKLVTCERCAEKLHYRRNREREQLERQQREDSKRNRKAPSSDEEVDEEDNIDQSRTKSEPRDKESAKRRRKAPRSDEEVDEEDDIDQSRTKSKSRDKENFKRQRERSISGDSTDEEVERSKDGKRKGKKALVLGANHEEDENFDEFMEGMFP